MNSWVVPLAAALLGGMMMLVCLGPAFVDPTNVDWLMHADYALHFLGWHLYRHGPWTLPLGATPLLIWPIGSSIGLTDSIPIAAFIFKPLDALLPATFQFIGLWLVACFALQGMFGALLMRLATPRPVLQLLGASLLVLSPPLMFRIVHAALTAHWLLLAALWLILRRDADVPSMRLALWWAALSAVTAATQPYLLLMVVVLMLAAFVRQALALPVYAARALASALISLTAAIVALWQSGSLMVPAGDGLGIGGFGAWSANLLGIIMPVEGRTLFSPGLFAYARFEQYEGYAYLGAGTLLLALVAMVGHWRSFQQAGWLQWTWRRLPLFGALVFLTLMALGPEITLGSRRILSYDASWWGPLAIFRTNGRMFWPVFYAIVVAILFAAVRLPYRRALAACALALIVQAIDLLGMVGTMRDVRNYGYRDPLQSGFWPTVLPHYDQLVLIPSNLCTREGSIDSRPFTLRGAVAGLAINSGLTARYDVRQAHAYCQTLAREIDGGLAEHGSLYIVRKDLLPSIRAKGGHRLLCSVVDGFGVCATIESAAAWRDRFDIPRAKLPATAEFVRFYEALSAMYRDVLKRPAVEMAGTTEHRVEGVARYLAYRLEGCSHDEAEHHALTVAPLGAAREACVELALEQQLPPPDQVFAFSRRYQQLLATTPEAGARVTHVDLEGEAVWLRAFARERAVGIGETQARATVLDAVRAAAGLP